MPFTTNGKRDYKRELAWEHKKKPNRVKDRAQRNAARSKVGLAVGDPRHVDHVRSISQGGTNSRTNLKPISAKKNLAKEGRAKKR